MTPQGKYRRLAALAAAALAAACVVAPSAVASDDDGSVPSFSPREVIVRFIPGTSPAQRADARAESGAKAVEGLGVGGMQLVRIADGESVSAAIDRLEGDPTVMYAQPNFIHQLMSPPSDPGFSLEWGLQSISAPDAWDIEIGSPETVVAVMDSGADLQHPDLVDNLWGGPGGEHGYDFLDDDADPSDLLGHGTHVSGTLLARGDNSLGVTGVSQRGQLIELRICGPYREGCSSADEVKAIDYAGRHGARILNGSLGGSGSDPAVSDAIQAHPDTLFVFSAGNGGDDGIGDNNDTISSDPNSPTPTYPCAIALSNVVCVAATNQSDQLARFSNYGSLSVDLGAPGTETLSTSASKEFPFEDFELTFDWTSSGWVTSTEAPLTSRGITDSPGGDYANNATYVATSPSFTIPAGYSSCELDYFRSIQLANEGDVFRIEAILSDPPRTVVGPTFRGQHNSTGNGSFSLVSGFDPGASMQVRLTLTTDGADVDNGVHMDDINLVCFGSPSDNKYEYLQGTSMAAPHVSGTAALLFSAKPSASVAEVKAALLNSVDPLPSLTGRTVSGGRLNAHRALQYLLGLQPDPGPTPPPAPQATQTTVFTAPAAKKAKDRKRPQTWIAKKPKKRVYTRRLWRRVFFRFRSNERGVAYLCKIDGKRFHQCWRKLIRRFALGKHVIRVKARDRAGNVDRTPAVYRFRVKRRR